jgi:hypothetical protein
MRRTVFLAVLIVLGGFTAAPGLGREDSGGRRAVQVGAWPGKLPDGAELVGEVVPLALDREQAGEAVEVAVPYDVARAVDPERLRVGIHEDGTTRYVACRVDAEMGLVWIEIPPGDGAGRERELGRLAEEMQRSRAEVDDLERRRDALLGENGLDAGTFPLLLQATREEWLALYRRRAEARLEARLFRAHAANGAEQEESWEAREIRHELERLRDEREFLRQQGMGEGNPKMMQLQAEMASLQERLAKERGQRKARHQAEQREAEDEHRVLEAAFAEVDERCRALGRVERRLQSVERERERAEERAEQARAAAGKARQSLERGPRPLPAPRVLLLVVVAL